MPQAVLAFTEAPELYQHLSADYERVLLDVALLCPPGVSVATLSGVFAAPFLPDGSSSVRPGTRSQQRVDKVGTALTRRL